MELIIDEKKIDTTNIDGANLEDILCDVVATYLPHDRAVTEVLIDDETFSETELQSADQVDRNSFTTLEIITTSSTKLAMAMLQAGSHHLDTVISAIEKVSELFRTSEDGAANAHYVDCLHAMQEFFSLVTQILYSLNIAIAQFEYEGISASEKLEELSQILTEMNTNQESGDYMLLADLMEYELSPLLKDWKFLLNSLSKKLN